MSYEAIPFPSFGNGLNLRDKVDAVDEAEAIDLLNVVFTERGAVKQRDGYVTFTSVALTNAAESLHPFYTTSGTKQLIVGAGTRLEALNTSGAIVASQTALTDGTWDFARFAAPGSELIYAGQGNDLLQKWNGTTWASVASTPKAGSLAVMSVEQGVRMVAGRFNTTTGGPDGSAGSSNPSRVYFSDPADPETWGVTNFVDFAPGDGEKVQAVVAWREFVFIFKETKFFVVYDTTEDAEGGPVFLWRAVDTGIGVASPRAVAVDDSGLYFMGRDGVYRTTGGEPELLSSAIDPIFKGGASAFYTGGILNHTQITKCAMGFHEEFLYLGFPTGTDNDRVLVYDPRFNWWSLYDFPAACFASFRVSDEEDLMFGFSSGTNDIGRHNKDQTSDDGTAIASRWRSGWFDYDLPERKRIRETKVWGSGKNFVAVAPDFQNGVGALSELDMTDPSVDEWGGTTWDGGEWAQPLELVPVLRRRGVRGTVFSTYFENSILNQSWAVHRLQHHLADVSIPSKKDQD